MISNLTTCREVKDVYQRWAQNYDFTANLYYRLGFRQAVEPGPKSGTSAANS